MSDPLETPWSNHTNAPQIPYWLYLGEKAFFAGFLIGAISYGIVVVLFFQCMSVLLNPVNPMKRGINWALIAHTVAMLTFLTIPVGIDLSTLFILYINNRDFPGRGEYPPGPLGYDVVLNSNATSTVLFVMPSLNQWLADGLLLYRCYVVYSMNHWVMTFPYLMYLASVAMGIAQVYLGSGTGYGTAISVNLDTSSLSISLSFNILLTLMIVMRLILHIRNVRKATGAPDKSNGLHTAAATAVTILIESYALYAITLLVYIVPWAIQSWVVAIFTGALGTVQVIAPYLIILRVANRRAITSETISGTTESIHFKSQGSTDDDVPFPDGDPTDALEASGGDHSRLGTGDESAIEEVPL